MKERVHLGRWRSEKAEQRFRAMEDVLLRERFGETVPALDVETSYGSTHVYRWPGSGVPIVFLHGMGGTGATWADYVERLPGRDVVAVDTMGDVGRSAHRVAFRDRDDLASWLDETLAALHIERAHLVGTSYGGFLALNQAIRRPARVASLTLLDPGGLTPIRMLRFILWGMPLLLGALAPGPVRRWLARRMQFPLLEDARLIRLALHAQRNHPFRLPPPTPFADEELRSITAPVTVLVAERSAPFDADVAARRAGLVPGATLEVVDGATHSLPVSHLELCCDRVVVMHSARDR